MSQLSMFDEMPDAPSLPYAAVAVRSHLRRVKSATPQALATITPSRPTTAPHNGTSTSRAAAEVVTESGIAGKQYARVVSCVRDSGARGLTREEIAQQTGVRLSAVCGRVSDGLKRGELYEDGTRKSAGGFSQKVVRAR